MSPGPLDFPLIPPCSLWDFLSQPHCLTVITPDVSPIRTFMIRINYLNFLQILLGTDMVGISSHIH